VFFTLIMKKGFKPNDEQVGQGEKWNARTFNDAKIVYSVYYAVIKIM